MSLQAAAAIFGGIGQIYGGYSAYKAGKKQASLLKQQGQLIYQESLRDAEVTLDDGKRFQQEQEMAYISSGVEIEGTPLLVMTETTRMAGAEAKAIKESGAAQRELYNKQAKMAKSEGKAKLIGSIFGASSNVMGAM